MTTTRAGGDGTVEESSGPEMPPRWVPPPPMPIGSSPETPVGPPPAGAPAGPPVAPQEAAGTPPVPPEVPAPYLQQWDPLTNPASPGPPPPAADDRPPRAGWPATLLVVVLVLVAAATGVVVLGGDDPRPPAEEEPEGSGSGEREPDDGGGEEGDDPGTGGAEGFELPEGEIPEDVAGGAAAGTIPYTTDPDPYAGLPDVTRDELADALARVFRRDLADCVADDLTATLPQESLNRVYYATSPDELTDYEERETERAWRGCARRVGAGG